MNWRDEKIEEVIKTLAKEYGLSEFQTSDAIESFFKILKTHLQSEDMPRILINGFGTFGPNPGSLRRRIKLMESKDRDASHLKEILKRLEDEEQSRKHRKDSEES